MGLKKYNLTFTSILYIEDNILQEKLNDEVGMIGANINRQIEEFSSIKCASLDYNINLEEILEEDNNKEFEKVYVEFSITSESVFDPPLDIDYDRADVNYSCTCKLKKDINQPTNIFLEIQKAKFREDVTKMFKKCSKNQLDVN